MDPIHPIVPVPPNIPPVAPTPMTGRVERDAARSGLDDRGRRRRPRSEPGADPAPELDRTGRDDGDDSGLHIDLIA